jgi:hypothetical protein
VSGNGKANAEEGEEQSQDEQEEEEKIEPEEAVRRYIRSKPPRGLPEFLTGLQVPGGTIGRMKVLYAAILGGSHARIEERLQAKDKYILSMSQDDKSQAAQLVALEHYLTKVCTGRACRTPQTSSSCLDMREHPCQRTNRCQYIGGRKKILVTYKSDR